jgi:hypothetical protein
MRRKVDRVAFVVSLPHSPPVSGQVQGNSVSATAVRISSHASRLRENRMKMTLHRKVDFADQNLYVAIAIGLLVPRKQFPREPIMLGKNRSYESKPRKNRQASP